MSGPGLRNGLALVSEQQSRRPATLTGGRQQRVAVARALAREPRLLLADGVALRLAGVAAGFAIGVVASLPGVAAGGLRIPTLVLRVGIEPKLAGSLPTMLAAFARYSRDRGVAVLRAQRGFVARMAAGSGPGAALGGWRPGVVPEAVLLPAPAAILAVSAVKTWRHRCRPRWRTA